MHKMTLLLLTSFIALHGGIKDWFEKNWFSVSLAGAFGLYVGWNEYARTQEKKSRAHIKDEQEYRISRAIKAIQVLQLQLRTVTSKFKTQEGKLESLITIHDQNVIEFDKQLQEHIKQCTKQFNAIDQSIAKLALQFKEAQQNNIISKYNPSNAAYGAHAFTITNPSHSLEKTLD